MGGSLRQLLSGRKLPGCNQEDVARSFDIHCTRHAIGAVATPIIIENDNRTCQIVSVHQRRPNSDSQRQNLEQTLLWQ